MIRHRAIYSNIVKHLGKKQFIIINGARQTGKTTILKQLLSHLEKTGKRSWFITLEKEDVLREINKNPENIFRFAPRPKNPLYEEQNETYFFLIDEIQYADNPSNFLKYLYDTYSPHLKIVATGSSSFYLDSKFKDSLAGRKRIFTLRTLNFEELLLFKDKQRLLDELKQIRKMPDYISLHNAEIMELFENYLKFGGYPEVVISNDMEEKVAILEEIKNAYIKRDILESKIENEEKFYRLMQVLAMQTGNLLNIHELSKSLKIDIKTTDRYIHVLQKCFHISVIKPYHKNLKKELVKMPKVFFNDLGLRNLLYGTFLDICDRADKGQLLENYVFLRLLDIHKEEEIKFWRTADQKEVDFLVSPSLGSPFALEVKFNSLNIKKGKYNQFRRAYPDVPIKYVSYTNDEENNDIISAIKL